MAMYRIILIALLAFVFSCKSKEQREAEAREKAKQDAQEQANKIAAPLIANILGNFNILVATAKNTNLPYDDRMKAISDLRENFCEFMCQAANIDSVNTGGFDYAVRREKDFIEAKCREAAAKQVYIHALQNQYEQTTK